MTHSDEIRLKVLNYSLRLERMASYVMGFVLDIEDYKQSKSFGNTGQSLSFNQKINLLLDYGAVDKNDKIKLDFAMAIRNQLMHNHDCNSFIEASKCIDGLEKKLKILYSSNFENDDLETNLEKCVVNLFEDSFLILGSLKGGIENKITLLSEHKYHKAALDAILKAGDEKLAEIGNEIDNNTFDFTNKEILSKRIITLYQDIFTNSVIGLAKKLQRK